MRRSEIFVTEPLIYGGGGVIAQGSIYTTADVPFLYLSAVVWCERGKPRCSSFLKAISINYNMRAHRRTMGRVVMRSVIKAILRELYTNLNFGFVWPFFFMDIAENYVCKFIPQ